VLLLLLVGWVLVVVREKMGDATQHDGPDYDHLFKGTYPLLLEFIVLTVIN
jgi:hypothetical protein